MSAGLASFCLLLTRENGSTQISFAIFFDDHPELFFVIALFKIVNFFLTRDLGFLIGDGHGDDDRGTLNLQLEDKWRYQTQKSCEVSVVHRSHFVAHLIVAIVW